MRVRGLSLLLGCLIITAAYANNDELIVSPTWPELKLISEHPVDKMVDSNLSGIAQCDGNLWAVSDRSDEWVYQLTVQDPSEKGVPNLVFSAVAEYFEAPPPPTEGLPWWASFTNVAIGQVRGGNFDFEGISCDKQGNRYLVSEAYLGVLKLSKEGASQWLVLPSELWTQAHEAGLLQKTNQMFEGIAIDPEGKRLWLAAERNKRGILALKLTKKGWQCPNNKCVLLSEGGREAYPKQFRRKRADVRDFSDMVFYKEKLFTLERSAFRICRRSIKTGEAESCWSIAQEVLQPHRQYKSYGMPEALWIDDEGAWVGVDNDLANKRIDGESRPIVWRFAAPKDGWIIINE